MTLTIKLRLATFTACLAIAPAAFAKTPPPAQTHHCKLADGTIDAKKTHKECDAAKGTWALDVAKDAPPAKDAKDAKPAKDAAPAKDATPAKDAKPATPPKDAAKPPATPAH